MSSVDGSPEQDSTLTAMVNRARSSPALLARFTAEYRGPHHPGDALDWLLDDRAVSRRGLTGPATTVDRTALYRRDVPVQVHVVITRALRTQQLDRAEAERALIIAVHERQPYRTRPLPGPRHPLTRRRRRPVLVVSAVCAALLLTTALLAVRHPARLRETARSVILSRGAVAPDAFYDDHPDQLAAWGRPRLIGTGHRLDGATPIDVATAGSSLLLIVACPLDDRSFEYSVRGRTGATTLEHGYGACGKLHPLQIPLPRKSHDLRVLVTTRGIDPFSLSVYGR